MGLSENQASGREAPAPGLLILTGASHTGKTSVAREILRLAPPPAAFLSVDESLRQALVRTPGNPWAQIPLAYELLRPQVKILLQRGWLVVFESTFTYVPEAGNAEFHAGELNQLVEIAAEGGAPCLVVQLRTDAAEIAARADGTQRLPSDVVAQTATLHDRSELPGSTLRLDSGKEAPRELARRSLAALA